MSENQKKRLERLADQVAKTDVRTQGRFGAGDMKFENGQWRWDRASIYATILAAGDDAETCLLPDHDTANRRWSAEESAAARNKQLVPDALYDLVLSLRKSFEDRSSAMDAYALFTVQRARTGLAALIQCLHALPTADAERFLKMFRWLAVNGSDREVIKFAIGVIGAFGDRHDEDILATLGRADTFTRMACTALAEISDDPEPVIWDIAKRSNGWARIYCVEALRDTIDPKIKDWLLRDGYWNTLHLGYTAGIAFQTGGLLEQLRRPDPDQDLLDGAADILWSLTRKGPAVGTSGHADAAEACLAFMEHWDRGGQLAKNNSARWRRLWTIHRQSYDPGPQCR